MGNVSHHFMRFHQADYIRCRGAHYRGETGGIMNIKDIARLSGVGIATVSRVINNSGVVSDATRAKVMAVVREHNYIPNGNASNLKKRVLIR